MKSMSRMQVWLTRSLQPPPVAGPALGEKKAQRHHYRHFTSCERQ
jgi:hypothetical protein